MPESNALGFPEQAVGKILADAAGVAAIAADRIYSPVAKQDTEFPCIVFRVIPPSVRDELFEAPGSSGLVRTRFRVFASMKTISGYGVSKRLFRACREALRGYAGVIVTDGTTSPIESIEIQGIFCHTTNGIDDYDDKTDVQSVFGDFDVWHDE